MPEFCPVAIIYDHEKVHNKNCFKVLVYKAGKQVKVSINDNLRAHHSHALWLFKLFNRKYIWLNNFDNGFIEVYNSFWQMPE